MTDIGWTFGLRITTSTFAAVRQGIDVKEISIHPVDDGGELSFDLNRDVVKALSGLMFIPEEARKIDNPAGQEISLYMVKDGVQHRMGVYSFTEETLQKSVTLDDEGTVSDIHIFNLGDRMARLIRNDGTPETLNPGFDPAQEMDRIISNTGIPGSVSGAVNISQTPVTWDGVVTDLAKVQALAELAGHRRPWMDNEGIIRSVQARSVVSDVIPLEDLEPTEGSIGITNTYLSAPNRFIVSDNGGATAQIVGQWDAPAGAPHSHANRGYYRTEVLQTQGLGSSSHAETVARTLGERARARQLTAKIVPTPLLDGPVTLSYDGSMWLVSRWTVNLQPGSTMDITAEEILEDSYEPRQN